MELLQPFYTGDEGYWTAGATAEAMDWFLYASHESSITIGGDWLLAEMKAVWPNWQQRLDTTWDYE